MSLDFPTPASPTTPMIWPVPDFALLNASTRAVKEFFRPTNLASPLATEAPSRLNNLKLL